MTLQQAIQVVDIMSVVRNSLLSEMEYDALKIISNYFDEKEKGNDELESIPFGYIDKWISDHKAFIYTRSIEFMKQDYLKEQNT